jgi:quinol monooxygenase YgiN
MQERSSQILRSKVSDREGRRGSAFGLRAAYNVLRQEARPRRLDCLNTDSPHYLVIWEFQVKPETKLAFEQAYGPEGDWARLFRQCPDYRGTQLVRDTDRPGRYLTFDRWTSRATFDQFKQAHRADYDAFDQRCAALTDDESLIGEFELLSASPTN